MRLGDAVIGSDLLHIKHPIRNVDGDVDRIESEFRRLSDEAFTAPR